MPAGRGTQGEEIKGARCRAQGKTGGYGVLRSQGGRSFGFSWSRMSLASVVKNDWSVGRSSGLRISGSRVSY